MFLVALLLKFYLAVSKPLYYPVSIFNEYVQYSKMQLNILQFQICHCFKFLKPVKKIQPKERCNLGGVFKVSHLRTGLWVVG